jgi:hypothetical protein
MSPVRVAVQEAATVAVLLVGRKVPCSQLELMPCSVALTLAGFGELFEGRPATPSIELARPMYRVHLEVPLEVMGMEPLPLLRNL